MELVDLGGYVTAPRHRYGDEQDNDPAATTDCATGSPAAAQVRVAEFQAFGH